MKTKMVIDADNQKVLERFNEDQTDETIEKYERIGKWNDIGIDSGGDIILWEE